jgi:hypothetical protein
MIKNIEPTSEIIEFDFMFWSDYWRNPPEVEISIDGNVYANQFLSAKFNGINFKTKLDFAPHILQIKRTGKTVHESRLVNGDWESQTAILHSLEVDKINLRNILWSRSTFTPVYDVGQSGEEVVKGECNFSYNGTWELKFNSPVYQFVVDCVRGAK